MSGRRRPRFGVELGARRDQLADDALLLGVLVRRGAADDVALEAAELDAADVRATGLGGGQRPRRVPLRRQRQRQAGPRAGAVFELQAGRGVGRRVGGQAIDRRDGVLERAARLVRA